MPRKSERQLARVTVRIFKDDLDKLIEVSSSTGDTGLNLLVRTIVHSYVQQLRDLERKSLDNLERQQQ